MRAPLLLMVDQEGGGVQRLPGAPSRSAAFTLGLRAGGVAATAKHFPGFGAAAWASAA